MKPHQIPGALEELDAELGAIAQRLADICLALPAPSFEAGTDRPLNAAAEVLGLLESARQDEMSLLRTCLRLAAEKSRQL